jgi:hypothetical protein
MVANTLKDLTHHAWMRSFAGILHCSLEICSWQARFSRTSGQSCALKQPRAFDVLAGACQPLELVHDLTFEALALQSVPEVVRKYRVHRFKSWRAIIFFNRDVDSIALEVQILQHSLLALQKSLQFLGSCISSLRR